VEGYKSVSEFLKSEKFPLEMVISIDNAIMENHGIPFEKIFLCKESEMKSVSNLVHPSPILAIFEMRDYELNQCMIESKPIFLLDGIQDPGNCGTIIRTADWFGIQSIIRTPKTADFYHPKVVQATMGSLNNIQFCTLHEFEQLQSYNKSFIGMDMTGVDLKSFQVQNNMVFVFGSEGNGISPEVSSLCDQFINIKGVEQKVAESLNVGVAASILAFHLNNSPQFS
jgi:TrmH family RNA methyltransferase